MLILITVCVEVGVWEDDVVGVEESIVLDKTVDLVVEAVFDTVL